MTEGLPVTDEDSARQVRFDGLHHVQLAIPPRTEDAARQFWGLVGLVEVEKPPVLAARGGCWFRAGQLEVHCGIDPDFRAAGKAHPGILVGNLRALAARIADAGIEVDWDLGFPGYDRFYVADPVGNRLEFMEPLGADAT
jgi:catechol 2,3-dioxygenase-like lactoylglutathione lyase family enzyme